ncbi:MAG TPA: hypothetical protein VF395_07760 [Polyangiaceae bacterium]
MRVAVSLVLIPLAFCFSCVGCQKEEPETTGPTPGVTKCLKGLEQASAAPTLRDGTSIYYGECADMFSDVSCRDAFRAAAKLEPAAQLGAVADACKKAYCPALGAFAFAICKDDFKATPESLTRDWPPLFDAIVAREAGMSAGEVSASLLKFYVSSAAKALASAAPSASSAPPAGSAPAPTTTGSGAPSAAPSADSPKAAASSKAGSVTTAAASAAQPKPAVPAVKTPSAAPHPSAR